MRRTKYGIPHIRAHDIESLAAGYAYAFAEDDICTIASEYVTVSGQRSRWFGPNEDWYFSGNGSTYPNLTADFYFKWANEQRIARKLLKQPPPLGPKRGVRKGVAGYVAGYNAYLEDVGRKGIPDPACRGEKWVRKIRKIDVYRRFFQLGILASSGAVIDGIVDAEPASPAAAARGEAKRDRMLSSGRGLERLQPEIGSNAYGLGKEATTNGRGLVLGNPHFPWDGSERLYQTHLQIPGKLNVEGASLYGVPLVLIGWTEGLAWSHTVATAWRFTPFKLTLPPGDPHSYIVDGETKPMEATKVTVKAKTKKGLEKRSKTIYSTEYGPMIDNLVGIPLPWTEGTGFALGDVNASNFRYLNHFYDNNFAQSVAEYDRIQRKYQGLPWVNSIAADSKGNAYYSMQGSIPNVPDELAAECNTLEVGFETLGLPVLDGSRSACNWEVDPDAVAPGTFPPDEVPTLFRDDYVHNGNDSHWLTNPEAPMTGYDRIIGIENAERTYRTRLGLVQVEDRLAGTDGLPGKGFDRRSLEKVALGNRQYLGELWRDSLVALCDAAPGGTLLGSSGPVVGRARLRRAAQLERPRRPRLLRRDPLPPVRLQPARQLHRPCPRACRAGRPRARRRSSRPPTRTPTRSTRRAASTSATRSSAGRSRTPSATSRAPASRSMPASSATSSRTEAASRSRSTAAPAGSASSTRSRPPGTGRDSTRSSTAPASSCPRSSPARSARSTPARSSPTARARTRTRSTPATTPEPSPARSWNDAPFCRAEVKKATKSIDRITVRPRNEGSRGG